MKDLIIIGSGGLGRETAWTVERINAVCPEWNLLGFFDDNPLVQGEEFDGYKILGGCKDAVKYPDAYYVCAIGRAYVRKSVVEKIKNAVPLAKFATLIDPNCTCSRERVKFGDGCIICANTYITLDIKIGSHVYIGGNSTVGHDARISDYVTVYPGANISGNTKISECCELGTGSQIIQGLSVGENTIVGAGSVIVRDLPANCTAIGIPAKPIKMHGKKI